MREGCSAKDTARRQIQLLEDVLQNKNYTEMKKAADWGIWKH